MNVMVSLACDACGVLLPSEQGETLCSRCQPKPKTLEARLEDARLRSADSDPLLHYERACLSYMVRLGVESSADTFRFHGTKEHWPLWAADSLLFAIDSLRDGRVHEAMRGWGQAREYTGRNGGFLPSGLSDALVAVQNALEKCFRGRK